MYPNSFRVVHHIDTTVLEQVVVSSQGIPCFSPKYLGEEEGPNSQGAAGTFAAALSRRQVPLDSQIQRSPGTTLSLLQTVTRNMTWYCNRWCASGWRRRCRQHQQSRHLRCLWRVEWARYTLASRHPQRALRPSRRNKCQAHT